MPVTIELSPDVEAELSARASARGLGLADYLRDLIAARASDPDRRTLSAAERAALLRDTRNVPFTAPLSDEAISRDAMYGQRG